MAPNGIAVTSPPSTATRIEPVSFLLVCGILSSLLYAGMNVFIPMQWHGYSSASQVVSELSAIGAPTRVLWVFLGTIYTLLFAAFGWGVWKAAGGNRPLRVVGILILASSLLGFVWPFAPMHQREALAAGGGTLSDTLHIVLAFVTVPLFLLTIGFGAAAFGRRFRLYSIVTIVIAFAFGVLTGLDAPGISANLPTPRVGLWERINIAAYMTWIVVLAVALLRMRSTATPAPGGAR